MVSETPLSPCFGFGETAVVLIWSQETVVIPLSSCLGFRRGCCCYDFGVSRETVVIPWLRRDRSLPYLAFEIDCCHPVLISERLLSCCVCFRQPAVSQSCLGVKRDCCCPDWVSRESVILSGFHRETCVSFLGSRAKAVILIPVSRETVALSWAHVTCLLRSGSLPPGSFRIPYAFVHGRGFDNEGYAGTQSDSQ